MNPLVWSVIPRMFGGIVVVVWILVALPFYGGKWSHELQLLRNTTTKSPNLELFKTPLTFDDFASDPFSYTSSTFKLTTPCCRGRYPPFLVAIAHMTCEWEWTQELTFTYSLLYACIWSYIFLLSTLWFTSYMCFDSIATQTGHKCQSQPLSSQIQSTFINNRPTE